MAIPASNITVVDPGLGVAGAATTTPIVIGISSSGTVNSPAFFGSPTALAAAFGYGTGVEAALQVLAYAGGPIGFCRVTGSVAASNSAVTKSGAGPTVTISGTALFDFSAQITITAAGAIGTSKFRYTLDGAGALGGSTTEEIFTAATYVLPGTGITVTFPVGSYVAGETYTFTCKEAGFASGDVTAALTACGNLSTPWRYAILVQNANSGDATAGAGIAAVVQSKLASLAADEQFRAAIMATTGDSSVAAATAITAFAATAADRVLPVHGGVSLVAQKLYPGRGLALLPASVIVGVRAAGSLISTDLKRVPGNGLNDGGPLPGVVSITHDERVQGSGLGENKIGSLRTYQGRSGFYVCEGPIKSTAGSDFTIWPRRLVIDVACDVAQAASVEFIGRSVRVNANGTIFEADALRLESEVQSALEARLINARNAEGTGGHASAVRYTIDRTVNIVATETLEADVAVRPLGYVKFITTRVGYKLGGTVEA